MAKKKTTKKVAGNTPKSAKQVAKAKKSKKTFNFLPDKRSLFILAALMALTFVSYLPSLENGFTNWDDDLYVTENTNLEKYLDNSDLLLTDNIAANRHPVTMYSLALDYKRSGEDRTFSNAKSYHAQSVFWHILNILLVFYFIWLVSNNAVIALVTAAIFGLHPMHVESVAWVAGRKDVLYTFFFLLSLISFLIYRKGSKVMWYGLSFVFALLSCAAKPAAVVIPIVMMMVDFFNGISVKTSRFWLDKVPFLALSLATGILTFKSQGETAALKGGSFFNLWDQIQFGTYSFFYYIYKFFVPIKMSSFHPYPLNPDGSHSSLFILFPLLFAALIFVMLHRYKKINVTAWGLAFYFITIVLVLQFITVGSAITSERYTYVPYIGLAYILGFGLWKIIEKGSKWQNLKIPALALAALCLVGMSYASYQRIAVWESSVSLWDDVVKQYPNDAAGRNNRGHAYRKFSESFQPNSVEWNNALETAKNDYLTSIKNKPTKNARAYSNLGMVYYKKNQDSLALKAYNSSIKQDPSYFEAWSNRGAIHARNGRFKKALKDFNKCIELNQTHLAAYLNRGILHSQLAENATRRRDTISQNKEYNLALVDYAYYLRLNPYNHGVHNSLGVTYQNLQQHAKAVQSFNTALQINPNSPDYMMNRAMSQVALGKNDLALKDVQKAQKLGRKPNAWLKAALKL